MERAFGLYGQPDRRVEAVGAVLRGTRGVVPVVYSFTRHIGDVGEQLVRGASFIFLENGSPRDLKPVRQTDLRLSILDFVQTTRS